MVRLTDHTDMTLAVDWGLNHKPNNETLLCDSHHIPSHDIENFHSKLE